MRKNNSRYDQASRIDPKLRLRDCCAGRNAEAVAVSMLRLNEYCVLARDCRAEVLELDIVG